MKGKKDSIVCLTSGILCLITLAVTVWLEIGKPTSVVQAAEEDMYVEMERNEDAETGEREEQTKVAVFTAEDYDFTVAVIPVASDEDIAEKICIQFSEKLPNLKEEHVRVLLSEAVEYESIADMNFFFRENDVDVCIILEEGISEDEQVYGIKGIYNEAFFWERLPVPKLADIMVRNMAIASKNKAIGLDSAAQGSPMLQTGVPTVEIVVGHMSNEKEKTLLMENGYREKLADGLLEALKELYYSYEN